jgi:hypothetical protein
VANKYLAAPPALILMLVLAVDQLRRGGARGWRTVLGLFVVVSLPFAPWAIKNVRAWGTPLFPLHCPGSSASTLRAILAGPRVSRIRLPERPGSTQEIELYRLRLPAVAPAQPNR